MEISLFFLKDPATTEIYTHEHTLALHDALPISGKHMARILLIEDSPTDTAVLTQMLERNGHQVLASRSAEDGIELCKRELPDLVLMDVVLPGKIGRAHV